MGVFLQGGPGIPISLGPRPGPHPSLCKKQSLGSHEAPGAQAFRRPRGGSQQVLCRMAAREAAGEPSWLEGCRAAGPQRWSAGSCCWAGRELQRPVRQERGGAAQMRRGEPLCRIGSPVGARQPRAGRNSLVPAGAWAEPSGRAPAPAGQCPFSPGCSTARQPLVPGADPTCHRPLDGWLIQVGGHADVAEAARGRGGEQCVGGGPEGRAPSLTSSVGAEEAQGDQGTCHQKQQ